MSPNAPSMTLAIPVEPMDHMLGSEHARVTVVEYGDFECPSCKVAAPTPKLLLERFPSRIRFVFRHFPMHEMLFDNQAHLKDKDLHRYAVDLGLDMARYTAEMDDHIYLQKVREHVEGGRRSHIRATPTFFVDGIVQDISFGMKALHDSVAAVLGRYGQ